MASTDLSPESLAVHAGRPQQQPGGPLNSPIFLASALQPGGTSEYARHGNPAWEPLEDVIGQLEQGSALAFSSGLAASAAVFSLVHDKAVVVAPNHGYNGTTQQLQLRDIELRLVDVSDTQTALSAIEGADLVWLESPTNPALEIADLPVLIEAAKQSAAIVAVDNTFSTPLRAQPLLLGADVVTHSLSKLMAGHTDLVLGAAVTNSPDLFSRLKQHRDLHGAIPGALESFLTVRGIRTLHVRLDRAESNATELHRRLLEHPLVAESRYPGFGTVISFVLEDADQAQRVTESSKLVTYATSLGGVESTWERRRRFAAEPETIPAGLIRLSVGIEAVEDLWRDIDQALRA